VARKTPTSEQASCLVCLFFQHLIALLILELKETFGECFDALARFCRGILPIAHDRACLESFTEHHPYN
jgi:hypothetical protein